MEGLKQFLCIHSGFIFIKIFVECFAEIIENSEVAEENKLLECLSGCFYTFPDTTKMMISAVLFGKLSKGHLFQKRLFWHQCPENLIFSEDRLVCETNLNKMLYFAKILQLMSLQS